MLAELYTNAEELATTIYFDQEDFFREKTTDTGRVRSFIHKAERFLQENVKVIDESTYALYGVIGNYYRIIGETQRALVYLLEALRYGERQKEPTKIIVNLIRIGEVHKYAGAHELAMEKFKATSKLSKKTEMRIYDDFILQHEGKCLLETGQLTEAKKRLRRALQIRVIKGDDALIASTKQVLTAIEDEY